MKLSKQERIAVLVIAVVILLGLGIFLFIVPKFEAIGTSSVSLLNKQVELQTDIDRAATKEKLGEDVINAYNDGRNIADMFFEEMKPYEADNEIREFIQYCKDNGVNIAVDSLSIGAPTVSTLGVSFSTEPVVEYDLKTYATQGQEPSAEELEALNRETIMQAALASTQAVGSIDVSFTVTTLNSDDMLKFIDIINDYYKQEDGGMMRKAIRLSNGLSITDTDVEKKYADYVDDLTAKAEKDGKNRLEKDTGKTVGKQDQNANNNNAADDGDGETANTNNNNKNDDKTTTFEENVCQVDVTLTMYSIERMQDPTEQLSAQNNQ